MGTTLVLPKSCETVSEIIAVALLGLSCVSTFDTVGEPIAKTLSQRWNLWKDECKDDDNKDQFPFNFLFTHHVKFALHQPLRPMQVKCICNATDSTYILTFGGFSTIMQML